MDSNGNPVSKRDQDDAVDLNNNISAKIRNPLAHLSEQEIISDVTTFASENQLDDIRPLLIKGAMVAKDPAAFESVPDITEIEKDAIRNEVLHKWRQPTKLYFTIILCSIGAAVQGWDQTGSNGANISFPDALGIPTENPLTGTGGNTGVPAVNNPNASRNQWIQGVINAAPYIASAFL